MVSAESVSNYSVPSSQSVSSDISNAFNQVQSIVNANNAVARQNVADARSWQENMQRMTMDYNSAEAAKNRDWQEYMSNTAHQREVRDLLAAGLNPVLSASGGNGAAVTSGASASTSVPSTSAADSDMSASSALVNLLSSWLNATISNQNQTMSALTALANTERTASASELVANINRLSAANVAGINAASAENIANITGTYQRQLAGYNALHSKQLQEDAQEWEKYMAMTFPNNMFSALGSAVEYFTGEGGFIDADAVKNYFINGPNFEEGHVNFTEKQYKAFKRLLNEGNYTSDDKEEIVKLIQYVYDHY